jgi:hypothetical protein
MHKLYCVIKRYLRHFEGIPVLASVSENFYLYGASLEHEKNCAYKEVPVIKGCLTKFSIHFNKFNQKIPRHTSLF